MRTLTHLKRMEMKRFPALSASLAVPLLAAALLAVLVILMFSLTMK